jgi:hypothetical protein
MTDCKKDATRGFRVCRVTLPALPTHPFKLRIKEILYEVNGPWEITWQPQ